ncbi:GerMN domain-containing protein [Paenibacillus spongiae]|uniref:GerMN domain-containing protein n=1 Tax=Paenibacillus spongiae TaxID=2909671 RepID=A0ABY5S1Q4_9BACL|nr:GerMN domain-containing protein [Paenibacillus spongiae]UVI27806.1 GerMN domain-containing protein [Paenibacillus spongiae]
MKRHITSRLAMILCLLLLALVAAGCGQKETADNQSGAAGQPDTTPGAENQQPEPEQQKQQIKVYFTDEEQTGLIEQSSEIVYENEPEKIEAVFKALQSGGSNGAVSLWENVKLLSAKIESGVVTLDIDLPDEARLGAPGEALALEAIEKTYFQLEEVSSIDILINGEQTDSLMGHEGLDHPIVKP